MGQFKPMVKMYTDEPSVILKLKKGGKVKSKAAGQSEGFKSMASNTTKMFEGAEDGVAPKKPSMAARRKAMNPNLYAKGGKVVRKQMGGGMPGAAGSMPPPRPMGPGNPGPMVSKPPMPLPRRGSGPNDAGPMPLPRRGSGPNDAGPMPMPRGAGLMGGNPAALAAVKGMMGMKKGGKFETAKMHADEKKALLNVEKKLSKHADMPASKGHKGLKAGGSTGGVKMGSPGGYKMGGSIMGNEGPYKNTKMVTAGKGKTSGTTGGVRMGNAGGYKDGGKAMKYASGGAIDSKMTRTTVKGGDWENRPANTSKPGKTNTTTGEVKKSNGGGYKMGGSAKKAYATGGQVVDDGKAEKMPRHFVSRPVANTTQSGTFKRGGKVEKEEKPSLRLVKTHTGCLNFIYFNNNSCELGSYRNCNIY